MQPFFRQLLHFVTIYPMKLLPFFPHFAIFCIFFPFSNKCYVYLFSLNLHLGRKNLLLRAGYDKIRTI